MNLAQLLNKISISGSDEEEKTAKNELINIRTQNPNNFFKNCMKQFINQENEIAIRQTAGTILAASVLISVIK